MKKLKVTPKVVENVTTVVDEAGGWLAALIFSLSFSFISATVEKFIVDEE